MAGRGARRKGPGPADAGVPEAALRLYDLPPRAFTQARNALARSLAARPAEAAAVRALPRPDALAHALDRVARARPREVEALLAAGERLRAGQRRALSGAGADVLRAAEDALRESARALREEAARLVGAEAGRPAAPALLARLELALRVAASSPDPSVRERLRRGAFARAPEAAGFGEVAGLRVVPSAAPAARAAPRGRAARPEAVDAFAAPRRGGRAGGRGGIPAADARAERRRAAEARRVEAAARREEARRARADRARAAALDRLHRALARAEAEAERLRARIAALGAPPHAR